MYELDNIIVLNDENGNKIDFEFLDLIEYNGEKYVVLLPWDESKDGEGVVVLKFEESKDENLASYISVDTLNAVYEIFKNRFKEDFVFVD